MDIDGNQVDDSFFLKLISGTKSKQYIMTDHTLLMHHVHDDIRMLDC